MERLVHISRVSRFRRFSALSPHGPPEEAAHLTLYLLPATTVPYLASRGV